MAQIINNFPKNTFTQFTLPQRPATQNNPDQSPHQPIASAKLANTTTSNNTLTKTVTIAAIAGAILAICLFKGPSNKLVKNFNNYMQRLDDKIFDYSQRYNSLGTIQKAGLAINKGLRKVLTPLKGINNITSFKDTGFRWLTDKLHLKWLMDWITNQFKKVTIKFSQKAHQNARSIVDDNLVLLRKYIPAIEKDNPDIAQKLVQKINQLETQVLANTSSQARQQRFEQYIDNGTKNLGAEVTKDILEIIKHPIKNIKKFGLYRTEVKAEAQRTVIFDELQKLKHVSSFNIQDKQQIMSEATNKIAQTLGVSDKESRLLIRKISKEIQSYGALSGQSEQVKRETIVNNLKNIINSLKSTIQQGKYSQEENSIMDSQIKQIEQILQSTNKKGTIEDILQLLNAGLKSKNPQEYIKAKNITKEMKTAINNAFDSELKMFDKFAEYSVGSAPTDVAGIVAPMALAAYAVSRGKDKDEKISATLKAGIPITGAVATSFIAAAKMITGIKGLSLGIGAGILLNAIGSKVDEQYKKYCEKQLYTQKAIAAFKNNLNKSTPNT